MSKVFLHSRYQQRGAALVISLAFIVLLTTMVVAFFSYSSLQLKVSNATANRAVVDVFAHGALSTILSDLRSEMANGATQKKFGTNVVFLPLTATNMVPTRIGTDDSLPNLVKRSVAGNAFYVGGVDRAVAVSTATASLNGRSISSARWNASLLLPKSNATSATDLTPTNTFVPPDWILVARDGSNPTTWGNALRWSRTSSATVTGRYAYAIYDEGGLLDVNAAGYPPGSATKDTSTKGGLAFADLTVIPGMTSQAITAIVGWRNYASSQPSGGFPSYVFDETSLTNYFQSIRDNISGFRRAANLSLYNGQSDRQFVSRQQLIQFLTEAAASNDSEKAGLQTALQYLGTFSRDLEQPSFVPDSNRPKNLKFWLSTDGGNDQGGGDTLDSSGAKQDLVNPAFLTVRASDGSAKFKRRFPLSRLALIKPNPSSGDAAKIYEYFGLTWDLDNARWVYNHGGADGQIYTLKDVPDTREPDFFEILRATIHCDSLGKQHAGLDNNNKTLIATGVGVYSPHQFAGSNPTPAAIDGIVNYQIMQIGANLIDQYDEDSYPTDIRFNSRDFYGIEDIPYFAGWELLWYKMRELVDGVDINNTGFTTPSGNKIYEAVAMLQPIIWNPHAPSATISAATVPTQFRVVAGSMVDTGVTTPFHAQTTPAWYATTLSYSYPATGAYQVANNMTKVSGSSGKELYAFPDIVLDPAVSILTFTTTTTGDAAFREPYRLRAPNYPVGSNASTAPGYAEGSLTGIIDSTLLTADGGSNTVIGFNCGKAWVGPLVTTDGSGKWLSQGNLNRDLKLKLQYKNPSSSGPAWLTYDVIEQVYAAGGNFSTVENTDSAPNLRGFRTCLRADPRTNRWGLFGMDTFPSINSAQVPNGLNFFPGNGVTGAVGSPDNDPPLYFLPQGITWKPSATATYQMAGNNTGGADAPGWTTTSTWNVADLMVNLHSTATNPNCGTKTTATPGAKSYYSDPDGVIRRSSGGNFSGDAGLPLYTGNNDSRPIVLNRAFRSVAEMGYAFRGVAWRNLEFFTPESGDAALLDAFCLNEVSTAPDDVTVAGRVNLNTRQPKVLQALIQGVAKTDGSFVSATEADAAAKALVKWTTDTVSATTTTPTVLTKGPLRNRSELVGKFVVQVKANPKPNLSGAQDPILDPVQSYSGFSSMLTSGSSGVFSATADAAIKRRRESVLRALVDSGNTRTWNLLIDLVAQTGRYPVTATDASKFQVESETRYWVHVAIDRYTGQIIDEQWELVTE